MEKLYFYETEEGGRSYLKYGRGDLLLFFIFQDCYQGINLYFSLLAQACEA